MNTGDSIAALAGKTVSGKRLNIYKALAGGTLPTVSVAVSPASVLEDGSTNFTYTLTRTAKNLSSPLTVNFGIAGTANAAPVGPDPADYSVLTSPTVTFNPTTKQGTVIFAAGSTSATVTVDPTADVLQELDESVLFTILDGTGYFPGTLQSATGIIDSEEEFTNYFYDDFATNTKGWTLGTEWQIGAATASSGGVGNPDPGYDNTPTADNGVAGVVIGGNASQTVHDFYYLTSPAFNTSAATSLYFEYARWLNSDFTPFMQNTVDVYNGTSWVNLFSTGESPPVQDNAWTPQSFNISSYKSTTTQVRFGFNIGSSDVWSVSSWNVDDVKIYGDGGVTLPVVTISANDSAAGETPIGVIANPGQFTLSRTGSTAAALTINLAASGTASSGIDFTAIGPTVTFAAGSSTALVDLNVIDDLLVEGSETAILTVAAGAGSGYTVGAASSATVNIADDDLPVITIVATDSNAAEVTGGVANPGQFTLYRSGPVAAALTVNVATSGTATNGTDYAAVPGTVTFAAGSSTAIININVTDDAAVEGTETVTLTVTSGSGYVPGSLKAQSTDASAPAAIKPLSTSTISIIDNDSSPASIIIDAYDQGWYDSTGFHGPANPNYSAGDANVTDGLLYRNWFAFNIPTLSSEITSASLKLKSYDVSAPSGSETFALYNVATEVDTVVAGGSGKTAIYTDLGDGSLYGSRSYTVAESNTTKSITLNAGALSAISAKSGSKFALGGRITTLDTVDNYEGVFGFSNGSPGDVQLVLKLAASPVVTVSASDSGAAETTGVANPGKFTLARSGSTTAALTVNIGMTGSATNGTDYTLIPTTVTFAAGAATADVNLTVTDDAIVEGSETAVLTVAAGAGYTVGAGASATVTIADNDLPVVTVIATDPTAAETAGAPDPGVFTLSRSGPTTNSLTVAVAMSGTATNGADYTTIPATATFAAGSATAVVNVAVIDDLLIEGATPETAILTIQSGLTYVVGAASSATVAITDNDLPVITVSATDALAEETSGAPNPGSFTLTRTGPTTGALTVAVAMSGSATNGVDYTTVPTTATFAAGSPTALVNINVIDDSIIEGPTPETAVLTVNPGSGYTVGAPANATVSIADNDFIPVLSLSSNYSGVSENSKENLVYKVSRTVGLADALTINLTLGGTAVRPSDYNAYGLTILTPTTATLSLAAGAASAQFELVTKGDLVKETNETIAITLAAGTGYLIGTPGPVQTTIINDDGVLNQIGTPGKDFIEAGSTKNLSGGAGDDVLIGSAAGNVLSGGTGNDLVTTGAGFDVITFGSASEGIDTVTDFNVLYDTLQVSAAGFGGGLTPGQSIDASQFTLGSSATNANHRFIYNALDGKLYFDSDGNGAISSVLFAQLATGLALNEDNIFAA